MNTHKAYVLVTDYVEENDNDHEQKRAVVYDPPRQKLIASGDEDFCSRKAMEYAVKNPGAETGVEENAEPDPYRRQWPVTRW